MKSLNRKGFTLVELIATIVLLSLVMSIAAYSINYVIASSKKKEYELLLEEISSSVANYYQECRYVTNSCNTEKGTVTIDTLIEKGFIRQNNNQDDKPEQDDKPKNVLNNPYVEYKNKSDNINMAECKIVYQYESGKLTLSSGQDSPVQCPTDTEYQTKKIDEDRG